MSETYKADFLIVGGGIVGISIARELKKRYSDSKIIVIDKEEKSGCHASGRNSGVLHAGFYYTANSLKAKFTREGNEELTKYCDEKGLKINKCAKLVVAKDENDLPQIDELLKRAASNGVNLKEVTEDEAREIEPRVKTHKRALYSPKTSSTNPLEVLDSIVKDAKREGIDIHYETKYISKNGSSIKTTKGIYEFNYLVNSAGLYADKVALDYGFSEKYRILPFKGLYLYSNEPVGSLKTNIYPVPDLRNPFLGVHFTITGDGHIKIGPTAIPAFWREQYTFFENFSLGEFIDVVFREAGLFLHSDFDFKRLAMEEIVKYSKSKMVDLASVLITDIDQKNFTKWGKAGIRAQLLDIKKKKLEMDFVIEGDEKSMHVLNAVSPGYTCSMPFSRYVCDKIEEEMK